MERIELLRQCSCCGAYYMGLIACDNITDTDCSVDDGSCCANCVVNHYQFTAEDFGYDNYREV